MEKIRYRFKGTFTMGPQLVNIDDVVPLSYTTRQASLRLAFQMRNSHLVKGNLREIFEAVLENIKQGKLHIEEVK